MSRDTLRFYEREGLIEPRRRTAAGYRLYSTADEERVRFIRRAQALGLSLDDIRALLRVQPTATADACRAVAERLRERIAILQRKRDELAGWIEDLERAAERCDAGAGPCPVVLDLGGVPAVGARAAHEEEEA
ncbi:MAG: MerR family transcriptional regulator [Vicinamibacteria bacterium]|nr:MerR family transcriptional regulator [Vicinamibacteria bacterium]